MTPPAWLPHLDRMLGSRWAVPVVAFLTTLVAAFVGLARKGAWPRYYPQPEVSWDTGHYGRIAAHGYAQADDTAFYPLWPMLLRALGGTTEATAHQVGTVLAWVLFAGSLVLLNQWLRRMTTPLWAAWAVFAFAWSPFSTFHGKAYTESLLGLLWCLCVWQLDRPATPASRVTHLLVWAALSFARPALLPAVLTGIATLLLTPRPDRRSLSVQLAVACAGLFLGYAGVALVMHQDGWDPLQPLMAQALWEKSVALRLNHLFNPETWGDNMLGWDVASLYLPCVLVVALVVKQHKGHPVERAVLFCALFAAAHSAAVFFTQPKLQSLSRYVLGSPAFFMGLAGVLPRAAGWRLYAAAGVWCVFSLVWLVRFWGVFPGAWVG